MIPQFDSFEYFAGLLVALLVVLPLRRFVPPGVLIVVTGVYLLFLIAPRLALWYLVFWGVVALVQRVVAATGERAGGLVVLWGGLALTLAPLVAWKVWPIEFVIEFNVWAHTAVSWPSDFVGWTWLEAVDFNAEVIAPIGLSFAAFRAADLLVKSNLGLVAPLRPAEVFRYGLFPPLLVIGPIATYDEVHAAATRPLTVDRFVDGASQVVVGLCKVFVVAFALEWSTTLWAQSFESVAAIRLWAALAAFAVYFYVNFAGYSDIAIGAATLLGADVRPNFDRPYLQQHPTAFWNSWHMSLTRFLRSNVFTPLAAGRPGRAHFATIVTMLLVAMWHGVTWATLVFGAYHGASLVAHRVVSQRRPAAAGRRSQLKPVLVFTWFAVSLPLLHLDLGQAGTFYRSLIGAA